MDIRGVILYLIVMRIKENRNRGDHGGGSGEGGVGEAILCGSLQCYSAIYSKSLRNPECAEGKSPHASCAVCRFASFEEPLTGVRNHGVDRKSGCRTV